jgi:hypothetical protein
VKPCSATLVLILGLFALPVQANPGGGATPRPADASAKDDSARELFERGVALLQEGKFDEALAAFVSSYRLEQQPVVLLNIGMCQKVLGDLVAAHGTLTRYLEEAGPTAQGELVDSARLALEELEAATGTLALQLDPRDATVLLDGEALGTPAAGAPVRLLPGRHEVEVRAEGRATDRQTVELGSGEAVRLVVRLVEPGGTAAPVGPVEPPDDGTSGLAVGAWVGVGVAAAAAVGATITGSLGLVARDDYVGGGSTDAALREDVVTLGLTTDALLGVAAAGAATALILFLVDAYGGDESPAAEGAETATALSVFPSPGGLVLTW